MDLYRPTSKETTPPRRLDLDDVRSEPYDVSRLLKPDEARSTVLLLTHVVIVRHLSKKNQLVDTTDAAIRVLTIGELSHTNRAAGCGSLGRNVSGR